MDWNDARLFLAVARAGQMLAAARRLGLSQATLSRRTAALESDLGQALLVRPAHGCALTETGIALAERLERVEAEMIRAEEITERGSARLTGTVRVGAPDGFGIAFLASRLERFASRHPELVFQLVPVPAPSRSPNAKPMLPFSSASPPATDWWFANSPTTR